MTHANVASDKAHRATTTAADVFAKACLARPYLLRNALPLPARVQHSRFLTALYLAHGKSLKELSPKDKHMLVFS